MTKIRSGPGRWEPFPILAVVFNNPFIPWMDFYFTFAFAWNYSSLKFLASINSGKNRHCLGLKVTKLSLRIRKLIEVWTWKNELDNWYIDFVLCIWVSCDKSVCAPQSVFRPCPRALWAPSRSLQLPVLTRVSQAPDVRTQFPSLFLLTPF